MDDKKLKETLGILAGAASMCWDEDGVFQSEQASAFVDEAFASIQSLRLRDDSGPIAQERLNDLLHAEVELQSLRASGVEKWHGYDEAMEMIEGK